MDIRKQIFPYKPILTDSDFQAEFITRYFARPTTHKKGEITEISADDFNSLRTNSLYTIVSLEWKIAGPPDTQYDPTGKFEIVRSVEEANKKSIELAEKTLPGLSNKLTNLFQFWLGH